MLVTRSKIAAACDKPSSDIQSQTTIHVNQGTNYGTINVYQDCTVYVDSTQRTTVSLIELNINRFDLCHLEFKGQPSLQQWLQIYFTPLLTYEKMAHRLYGANIVEQTGCVELPLWQIRQAYLVTLNWEQRFNEALMEESNKAKDHSQEAPPSETLELELAIATVLKHALRHPKESLVDYSGCENSLHTLINLVSQPTTPQNAEYLMYALSLLITLSLRNTGPTAPREQILSFLKGKTIALELHCRNHTYKTLPLKLTKGKKIRECMFIDLQHTCWSKLDLKGLDFSGMDCTRALFVNSQNLTEARHCCFEKINSKGLVNKPEDDLTGTYASHEGDAKQVTSYYFFWGLSYLLQSSYCNVSTEKNQKLRKAYSSLTHIENYLTDDKGLMLKLHLAMIAIQQKNPQKALHLLFTAWQLNKEAVMSLFNPEANQPAPYLSPLGWQALKLQNLRHQHHHTIYSQLSKKATTAASRKNSAKRQAQVNQPRHRNQDKTLEPKPQPQPQRHEWHPEYPITPETDTLRQAYLEFLITLWPDNVPLYNELSDYPNPYGVRQSERLAYEKLSDSTNRLFQSNKPNHSDLPTVEIQCLSLAQGYLRPSLIEHLIDLKTGRFKKDNSNPDIKHSQHDVVRLDFKGHSVHIKAYPDFPMMDYLTDIFNRRLVGLGSPPSEFAVITVTLPAKKGQLPTPQRHPVLISLTMEGPTLKTVLAKQPELLSQLDPHTTSAVCLAEMFTHTGDGVPRNYVLTPTHTLQPRLSTSDSIITPTYTIISIDNSQRFVEPVVKTLTGNVLYECSILYCLKAFQTLSLSRSLMATFKDLNILGMLRAWLQTTQRREKAYLSLIHDSDDGNNDIHQWNQHRSKHQKNAWIKQFFPDSNPFVPIALLRPSVASLLAIQLQHLKSLMAFAVKESQPIKLLTLFKTLSPRIQHYYTQLDQTSLDSEALFKAATGKLTSMSSAQALEAITGEVLKEQDVLYEWRSSQAQGNSYLEAAGAELDVINFDTYGNFEKNNHDEYILSVNFYDKQRHASQAKLNAYQQLRWLNNLSLQKLSFSKLTLKFCGALSDALLMVLLENSTHLTHLDISGCRKVTQASLRFLAEHCAWLTTLKANGTDMSRLQAKNAKPLQFPALKTFHCAGLETNSTQQTTQAKGLTLVNLSAPQLIRLKLSHQPHLITLKLTTPKLQHLILKDCSKLSDEGLHCPEQELQAIQLDENNPRFAHITFRTRHLILFTALPWPHYSDTFVQQLDEHLQTVLTRHHHSTWLDSPLKLRQDIAQSLRQWGNQAQQVIPKLLKGYKNKIFAGALGQCALHHPQQVIPELIKALNDNLWDVRQAATTALGQCAQHYPQQIMPALIHALNNKYSWYDRPAAAAALGQFIQLDPEQIIPELINALNDNLWDVRQAATTALGQCAQHYPQQIMPALIHALNDRKPNVRQAAVLALGQCAQHDPEQIIPELIKAFNNKDSEDVRRAAAKALGQCVQHDLEQVIPALIKALNNNDSGVRPAAAHALGQCAQHNPEQVISALIKALNNNDSHVREATAKALGLCAQHNPEQVISALKKALNDNDVRRAAAKALGQCAQHDPEQIIPELINALNDKYSEDVRRAATYNLRQSLRLRYDKKLRVREAAAKALGQCAQHDPEQIIPALIKALNDKDLNVRRAFIYNLWPLILLRYDKKLRVREAAAKALGQCAQHDPEQIIPALIKALNDKDLNVRPDATHALGQCAQHDPEQIIPELINALNDKGLNVRQAAANALGQCVQHDPEQIIPALIKALSDKVIDVRHTAAEALGKLVSFESLKKVITTLFENAKRHANENHNNTSQPSTPVTLAASYQNLTKTPLTQHVSTQQTDNHNKEQNVQYSNAPLESVQRQLPSPVVLPH